MAWSLVSIWDHSATGDSAGVNFTGLAGAEDLMVFCKAVTKSSSGQIAFQLSVNNGSSYYASAGDYETIGTNGVVSLTNDMIDMHTTNSSSARYAIGLVYGCNVAGTHKMCHSATQEFWGAFVASTDVVNAIRILPSNGGNFTGGTIQLLKRT